MLLHLTKETASSGRIQAVKPCPAKERGEMQVRYIVIIITLGTSLHWLCGLSDRECVWLVQNPTATIPEGLLWVPSKGVNALQSLGAFLFPSSAFPSLPSLPLLVLATKRIFVHFEIKVKHWYLVLFNKQNCIKIFILSLKVPWNYEKATVIEGSNTLMDPCKSNIGGFQTPSTPVELMPMVPSPS